MKTERNGILQVWMNGILDYFVEKDFNGSSRYFLDVDNVVAIAYQKPVKFHKYDPKTGMNSFDLRK